MHKKALMIAIIGILFISAIYLMVAIIRDRPASNSICASITSSKIITLLPNGSNSDAITINKCTEVTFQNNDSRARWPAADYHPTHGIYPEFDPQKEIAPGKSWSFVFEKTGTWKFHDHLLPTIRGKITVID